MWSKQNRREILGEECANKESGCVWDQHQPLAEPYFEKPELISHLTIHDSVPYISRVLLGRILENPLDQKVPLVQLETFLSTYNAVIGIYFDGRKFQAPDKVEKIN